MLSSRSYGSALRLIFGAAPRSATLAALATLVSAGLSTAAVILLGTVVGATVTAIGAGAGSPEADRALLWMVVLAVVLTLTPLVAALQTALGDRVMAAAVSRAGGLTAELANAPVGVGRLEDPDESARLRALVKSQHEWTYLEGLASTWAVIGIRLAGVGAFVVLALWHWWVAVVLAAGYLISGWALTAWLLSVFKDMALAPPIGRRRAAYLYEVLQTPRAAKEIRLFGLSGWLTGRYRELWTHAMLDVWRRRNRTLIPILLTTFVLGAAALLCYGVMAREAWTGAISPTMVTTLVGASIAMGALGMLGDQQVLAAQAMATTEMLRSAREQVGLPGLRFATSAGVSSVTSKREPGPAHVRIENLHFGYPARATPVFDGLDLEIPAGQSIAVVGVNGAGKSTLIKLLCGLYAPDAGTVQIDGADPATDETARERVAVIFQDFVRYQLSLRHNVALGARGRADDDDVVRRALHDAGADELTAGLSDGWDTVLSGEYADGTDLSGGQWQRIALARALAALAGGSGVLVLDEPTAALDVRAEAYLFDRFLEVTRGMTTILVSHRLSSVRHADRIVVIDGGRIVEDGSHDELLAGDGAYATMFRLQASRFESAGAFTGLDEAAAVGQA